MGTEKLLACHHSATNLQICLVALDTDVDFFKKNCPKKFFFQNFSWKKNLAAEAADADTDADADADAANDCQQRREKIEKLILAHARADETKTLWEHELHRIGKIHRPSFLA